MNQPLSPVQQEVLDAAQHLVDYTKRREDLPHAVELCAHFHPDGPLTPAEVAMIETGTYHKQPRGR